MQTVDKTLMDTSSLMPFLSFAYEFANLHSSALRKYSILKAYLLRSNQSAFRLESEFLGLFHVNGSLSFQLALGWMRLEHTRPVWLGFWVQFHRLWLVSFPDVWQESEAPRINRLRKKKENGCLSCRTVYIFYKTFYCKVGWARRIKSLSLVLFTVTLIFASILIHLTVCNGWRCNPIFNILSTQLDLRR